MTFSPISVDSPVDNPRPIHETVINPASQGSPINPRPRGEFRWLEIAIFILFMALISSPIVFVFMELR